MNSDERTNYLTPVLLVLQTAALSAISTGIVVLLAAGLAAASAFAQTVPARPVTQVAAQGAQPGKKAVDVETLARGRYLVRIGGCNDCHTAGYNEVAGKLPEDKWLMGDRLGWKGPWGTTYPTNLRLYMAGMTQEGWLKTARTMQPRPPMPWFNVHAMNDQDLTAIYQFVRALGPAGEPAPAYVPPGQTPKPPYIQFPQ